MDLDIYIYSTLLYYNFKKKIVFIIIYTRIIYNYISMLYEYKSYRHNFEKF